MRSPSANPWSTPHHSFWLSIGRIGGSADRNGVWSGLAQGASGGGVDDGCGAGRLALHGRDAGSRDQCSSTVRHATAAGHGAVLDGRVRG